MVLLSPCGINKVSIHPPTHHPPIYLSIYLYIYRSIDRSIYLPTYLYLYLYLYLSINLPTYPPTYLSLSLAICLSTYLSIYPSIYLPYQWYRYIPSGAGTYSVVLVSIPIAGSHFQVFPVNVLSNGTSSENPLLFLDWGLFLWILFDWFISFGVLFSHFTVCLR